jgi:hypothetical protein
MRKMEPIETWDWYDGFVTGIVRLSWSDGVFLASLVAWSQSARVRVYGLLPLSNATAARLRALMQGDWHSAVVGLRDYCEASSGQALVLRVDERAAHVVAEAIVAAKAVAPDMAQGADRALLPDREHWLVEGTAQK